MSRKKKPKASASRLACALPLRCERDLLIALERLGGAGQLVAIAFEAGLTMREADVAAERLRQSGILATAPDEATTSLRSQSILRWAV